MNIENIKTVHIAVINDRECIIHWNVKIRGVGELDMDDYEPCVDYLTSKGYSINNIQWGVINKQSNYHEE